MATLDENDFRWLVGDDARPYLEVAANVQNEMAALSKKLRQSLSETRARMILEQCELRRRARVKFTRAADMFFTRTLLEQATEQRIAEYKASRPPRNSRVIDLCCGIGGDLIGWASAGRCLGVDRDPLAAQFAKENCRVNGWGSVDTRVADAGTFDVGDCDAWHIDPDRRAQGTRTTSLARIEPAREAIDRLLERCPHAGVKLAPGSTVDTAWQDTAELEWIGTRRECRQQVAWFGSLALHPGMRRATVLHHGGEISSVLGPKHQECPVADEVRRYVFEPHAAVLAAHLAGPLCEQYQLAAILADGGYLTGDSPSDSGLLSCFEVLEVVPFDDRRLRTALRARKTGELEIKARGVDVDPARLRQRLLKQPRGDQRISMLVLRMRGKTRAVLGRRMAARMADVET